MKQTAKPVKIRTGKSSKPKKTPIATSSIKIPTYSTNMGLTSRQAYRLNKKGLNTVKHMSDSKTDQIRAIGEAVAAGTAPAASAAASSQISSDQASVQRKKENNLTYKIKDVIDWNKLLSGNPDKETGQDGTDFTRTPSLGGG